MAHHPAVLVLEDMALEHLLADRCGACLSLLGWALGPHRGISRSPPRGRTRTPEEAIAVAPDYVAVAIEIEQIDDRQARFVVERGSIALRR